MKFVQRTFCLLMGWGIVACTLHAQQAPVTRDPIRNDPRPNLILLVAEGLGYGDLSCFGQSAFETPNIDRLAKEGIRFTQAYAGSSLDVVGLNVLMTGRHSGHTQNRSNDQIPLIPEDVTLAEVLRTAAYPSAAIGKWSLGWEGTTGHPRRQGFDEFFGFLEARDAMHQFPTRLWRNEEAFVLERNLSGLRGDYAPDWFLRASTNAMRLWRSKPFFLFLSIPHPEVLGSIDPQAVTPPGAGSPFNSEWSAEDTLRAYRIQHLDATVGVLLNTLRELLLDEDTLVLLTSSRGPWIEETSSEKPAKQPAWNRAGPFRAQQDFLFEGALRVPLLVRWPGRVPPGKSSDLLISATDILPTFAELAKASRPKNLDGISFMPTLLGREQRREHEYLYWEVVREEGKPPLRAVRSGPWKGLLMGDDKDLELYHLEDDPGETQDVARNFPDKVQEMHQWMQESSDPWKPKFLAPPSPLWDAPKTSTE